METKRSDAVDLRIYWGWLTYLTKIAETIKVPLTSEEVAYFHLYSQRCCTSELRSSNFSNCFCVCVCSIAFIRFMWEQAGIPLCRHEWSSWLSHDACMSPFVYGWSRSTAGQFSRASGPPPFRNQRRAYSYACSNSVDAAIRIEDGETR